jgi:hypothetical protein
MLSVSIETQMERSHIFQIFFGGRMCEVAGGWPGPD